MIRKSAIRWICMGLCIAVWLVLPGTPAEAATTEKEFGGDKHVTIDATDENGQDTGHRLYDGDVTGGDKVKIVDNNPDHAEINKDAATNSYTENDVGPVKLIAGLYKHIPLDDFLRDYGATRIPEIYVSGDSLYYTVDLIGWFQGSPLSFSYGDSFTVVAGECPDLPGFKIGTEPLVFSNSVGWINNSPYTGTVHVWGQQTTTQTVPLLSPKALIALTLALLGAAAIFILRRRGGVRKTA